MKKVRNFKIFATVIFATLVSLAIILLGSSSNYKYDSEDSLIIGYLVVIGVACIIFTWIINPSKYDINATYRPIVNDLRSGKKHWYIVSMDLENNLQLDILSPEEVERIVEKSGGMRSITKIGNESVKRYLIQGTITTAENENMGIRHVDEVQKIISMLDAEVGVEA
jgi:hypothetical protein